jgi:hypothetical protein
MTSPGSLQPAILAVSAADGRIPATTGDKKIR